MELSYSKKNGQFYTRREFIDKFLEHIDIKHVKSILEPSFGYGILFIAVIEKLMKIKTLHEVNDIVSKSSLYELDNNAFNIGKDNIIIFLKKHNISQKPTFYNQDFLKASNNNENFIITNPPYIRRKNLDKEIINNIDENYLSYTSGNFDMYIIFIIKIILEWKSADVVAIIPSSFQDAQYSQNVRKMIEKYNISIYDFSSLTKFDNIKYATIVLRIFKNMNASFNYYLDYKRREYINSKITLKARNPIATLNNKLYLVKNGKIGLYVKNAIWPSGKIGKIIFPYKKVKGSIVSVTWEEILIKHPELKTELNEKDIDLKKDAGFGRKQYIKEYFNKSEKKLIPTFIKQLPLDIIELGKNDIPMSGLIILDSDNAMINSQFIKCAKNNVLLRKNGGYIQISTKNFERKKDEK